MSGQSETVRGVTVSRADKILFPDDSLTKGNLVAYYDAVSDVMLPHLRGRPLSLQRFPDGISESGFVQQHRPDYFPDWIGSVTATKANADTAEETVEHVLCENAADLVYLANQAVITLHAWPSRQPSLDCPDRLIFDLDPPGEDFAPVRFAAQCVVRLMDELGMNPHVMTTGSSGLHVVAPLRADANFDEVRELAQSMAAHLADGHPDELTTEQRKDRRKGRVYLDVMRNAYGQTAVAPYSVRPRAGAPVATPLTLAELNEPDLDARTYRLGNIRDRLEAAPDPWKGIGRRATGLATARRQLLF